MRREIKAKPDLTEEEFLRRLKRTIEERIIRCILASLFPELENPDDPSPDVVEFERKEMPDYELRQWVRWKNNTKLTPPISVFKELNHLRDVLWYERHCQLQILAEGK